MSDPVKGKSIVLGVTGGIAAYKSVALLRLLAKAGADCRVIMTKHAGRFVGALTFEALSGRAVCSDLFDGKEASIRHIDWAQAADLVVVAPATANLLGKLANGIADDALSTFLMAVTCPVVLCPSMNTNMYQSRPVQRNLDVLRDFGIHRVDPMDGSLACGTTGPGRLAEPDIIMDRLVYHLSPKDFAGKRIMVTAGPTREPVDPVRFISNPSSGKMGYALADAAEKRGAQVTLVSGPTHLAIPNNVTTVQVETAAEMADAVFDRIDRQDILIKAAAVSDFRPAVTAAHKVKKTAAPESIALEKTTDILKTVGQNKQNRVLVGFAAETRDIETHALEKLNQKNLDMIVANRIGAEKSGFCCDTNEVTLFYRNGDKESLPLMDKSQLAHKILDRIRSRCGLGR